MPYQTKNKKHYVVIDGGVVLRSEKTSVSDDLDEKMADSSTQDEDENVLCKSIRVLQK